MTSLTLPISVSYPPIVNLSLIHIWEEHPEGLVLEIDPQSHPLLAGMPEKWPPLLGYNKLAAKADADVVISWKGDPILALGTYGEGRSFAWASDCAPHWMPADFCGSDCNRMLWERAVSYTHLRIPDDTAI